MPTLTSSSELLQQLHDSALANILVTNSISAEPSSARILRAGGGYDEPWTRDAAINAWNGVSLVSPSLAEATLWATTEPERDGGRVIAQDKQWWDQIIWVVGAHNHWLVTGEAHFLADAYDTGVRSMRPLEKRLNRQFGLFAGGALMQDGIAGYPEPVFDPSVNSTFVLDHTRSHQIMCLSTNIVYQMAFASLATMAQALGRREDATSWRHRSHDLTAAINRHLWIESEARFGYFTDGELVDFHHETLGNALAIISGVVDPKLQMAIVAAQPLMEYGPPAVWPHFDRFDDRHPGRHNGIVWPMITGFWASALARQRDVERFGVVFDQFVEVVGRSGNSFYEVYDGTSGDVSGGWQNGELWLSEPDQTWSASAFLRVVYDGLLGLRMGTDGIRFEPLLPPGLNDITVSELSYRDAVLTVTVMGEGARVVRVILDGESLAADSALHLAASAQGPHSVEITVAH